MRSVCASLALIVLAPTARGQGAAIASSPAASQDAVVADEYVPLAQLRDVVPALRTPVTVIATRQPLEQVLEQIAEQADVGLSYGENLVRARVAVSLHVTRGAAADALLAAVRGTAWDVLATQNGRVTVVPRSGGRGSASSGRLVSAVRRAWHAPIR